MKQMQRQYKSEVLKNLIKEKKPFAVLQYYNTFIGNNQSFRKYELMYLSPKKMRVLKRALSTKEVKLFKNNVDKGELVVDCEDGKVWEFENFKSYAHERLFVC